MPVLTSQIPGAFADPTAIPEALDRLRETPPPTGGVLSAYLDTTPGQISPQTYLLSFRDACREVASQLGPDVRGLFDEIAQRAEDFLADLFVARNPGIALFFGADPTYAFAVPLPEPPAGLVAWDAGPVLAPLEAVLDDHERVAVALVDRQRARLLTVFLGAIETDQTVDIDPTHAPAGPEDPRGRFVQRYTPQARLHGPGGPFVKGGVARDRREHEEIQRQVRLVADALGDLLRQMPFDRLFLAGSDDVVARLRRDLPRSLRARLVGTLSLPATADAAEVLRVTRAAAEAIEREVEVSLVDELVSAPSGSLAVLGLDPTFAALGERRVGHLLVADALDSLTTECPACERLVAGPGPCPVCGGRTEPVLDLRQRVVEQALDQGARVEFVAGAAAARLLVHGGLGAWTRY